MTAARTREMRTLLGAVLLWLAPGCGGEQAPEPSGTITRDAFVGTYVELRMAAVQSPDGRVTSAAKEEILEARGITEADLLEFAAAHGPRVQFMADVWGEIDDTLRALRTREDAPPS